MAHLSSSILGSPFSIPALREKQKKYVDPNMALCGIPFTKGCQPISWKLKGPGISLATKDQVCVPAKESPDIEENADLGILSIHHVGLLCENLERSLAFYQNLLGLRINEARPNDKLPFRGAWLWVGNGMIHLSELPNPDALTVCPGHGSRDRHTCIAIKDVSKLQMVLDKAGISYTLSSQSDRPRIFTRDPDANALEFTEVDNHGTHSIHHVGLLCENLERSLAFYQNLLGLKINEARPNNKLPFKGAWLWVGNEMIHLSELPNPYSVTVHPGHGSRDRHTCIAIKDVSKLQLVLDKAGITYTPSNQSGTRRVFSRDPDGNALEFREN